MVQSETMTKGTKRLLLGATAVLTLAAGFLVEERVRGVWAVRAFERELRTESGTAATSRPLARSQAGATVRVIGTNTLPIAIGFCSFNRGLTSVVPPNGTMPVLWRLAWYGDGYSGQYWEILAQQVIDLRAHLGPERNALTNHLFRLPTETDRSIQALSALKRAAFGLQTATLFALQRNQPSEALEDLLAQLALLDIRADQPAFVNELVRVAVTQITFVTVWQALQADGWTDAQLATLQATCARPRFLRPMRETISWERTSDRWRDAGPAQLHEDFLGDDSKWWAADADTSQSLPKRLQPLLAKMDAARRQLLFGVWWFAWREQDHVQFWRRVGIELEAARQAEATRDSRSLVAVDHEANAANRLDQFRFWSSLLALPRVTEALHGAVQCETWRELNVTAIALKRYRLRHGHWPARIEELVPEFLAAVPPDWMRGQPLCYRRNPDETFTLYSVGWNGQDDGGDPTKKAHAYGLMAGRDHVWPRAATDEEMETAAKQQGHPSVSPPR